MRTLNFMSMVGPFLLKLLPNPKHGGIVTVIKVVLHVLISLSPREGVFHTFIIDSKCCLLSGNEREICGDS